MCFFFPCVIVLDGSYTTTVPAVPFRNSSYLYICGTNGFMAVTKCLVANGNHGYDDHNHNTALDSELHSVL